MLRKKWRNGNEWVKLLDLVKSIRLLEIKSSWSVRRQNEVKKFYIHFFSEICVVWSFIYHLFSFAAYSAGSICFTFSAGCIILALGSYSLIKILSWLSLHVVKSIQIRNYFWSVFFRIHSEYRNIRARNNSVFGHFSRSVIVGHKYGNLIMESNLIA